jgi:hypothetical protein
MTHKEQFKEEQGIFVPCRRPHHRDKEYDEMGFDVLLQMQRKHFWYRGRHKLLLNVLKKEISQYFGKANGLRAIGIGGGCGGWLEYLQAHGASIFQQLALGDSSMRAHRIPAQPINKALAKIFSLEASMVNHINFPWGTSILALFRR